MSDCELRRMDDENPDEYFRRLRIYLIGDYANQKALMRRDLWPKIWEALEAAYLAGQEDGMAHGKFLGRRDTLEEMLANAGGGE